jgi:pimeloyl-ACP methyl ester carboxylesterase
MLAGMLLLGILIVVFYTPVRRSLTTIRLLRVLQQVASADIGESAKVRESQVQAQSQGGRLDAYVYRPAGFQATSGVLLIPGVSELGCNHPKLKSLARAMAQMGILVLCPDIKPFREFQIYPPPLKEISFWIREIRKVAGAEKLSRVGVAGISFSGTLAMMAVSEPQNRDSVDYVLSVGAFDNLMRCSDFWFGAGPVTVSVGYFPTRYYAKWIIMLAALDMLPEESDRAAIDKLLHSLLLQQKIPDLPESAGSEARRWRNLALLREDRSDPELATKIKAHVASRVYPAMDMSLPGAAIHCPVFLVHGAYDDLIPAEESGRLKQKITSARSFLLISPFLTHTHAWEKPIGWWTKAAAVGSLFAFFYHLSGVL